MINDDIMVSSLRFEGTRSVSVEAPKEVPVHRQKFDAIRRNEAAAGPAGSTDATDSSDSIANYCGLSFLLGPLSGSQSPLLMPSSSQHARGRVDCP